MLSHRERLLRIFNYGEPDRLPLDVACAPAFREKLLTELGTDDLTKLGYSEELQLGIKSVSPDISDEFREKGAVVNPFLHSGPGLPMDECSLKDEWGVVRRVTASQKEGRIVYHPLKDATIESLDEYPWPDPHATGRFKVTLAEVREWKKKYLVSGGWGGDTFWCQAWFLRGFNQLIMDMYSNPEFAKNLFDKLLNEWYLGVAEHLVGLDVDMTVMTDDVAAQTGMILSPTMWRKFIKPCYRKLIEVLKPTVKYVLFHTDGNFEAIMPDLIEVGVDGLWWIQPDCMDLAKIKEVYYKKLILWGGLSVQDVIPHGTVEDVKNHVKETIRALAPGGGFVLATSNNVTQDTPIKNFLAIFEAAKKYGKYPTSLYLNTKRV